ncbi:uncharacterized protein TRIVIDRAFT_69148 [Trichoderma virens Gv29-8]|uniref:Cell cycle control protein n=1 Tax=Hypocrea virens (strain Gv29-8 / FGSC 10586) TaxID=413071 RepID=G9MYK5_HYPVG|nr:uncharacterized protein TRIVIDRAFT_69148 [Trichoderma virens Gv29-8]EHK20625.1 hypothetical protein TRIVIDRAFT_69148 [Trichoderma virens Gv29-8]UKZ53085.1 hypothetical protein TrVGV298_006873 [Trichoderma virens]
MSRAGDDVLGSSDDDLVEVEVTETRSIFENILHPRGVPSRRPDLSFSPNPPAGHSRRPQPAGPSASQLRLRPSNQASTRRSRPPPAESAVIDLTEEPDSPVDRRRIQGAGPQVMLQQVPHNSAGRHPRRTNSLRISPPQLARSDSTFVNASSVIDLTADSPEDEQRPNRESWRTRAHPPRHHHHHHHHTHDHLRHGRDRLVSLDFINHHQLQSDFQVFGRTLAGFLSGNLGGFGPELQTIFPQREPTPKPPMEPVPPTRMGFTRDTRADGQAEQMVVVCPACNEELAYDPADAPSTPSKKRKRAPGEHHFWALKKCGHVYCAECFENRRPTKTSPDGVGFVLAPGGKSTANPDIRCAVEGCESKATHKTEWVGIFL